MRFFIYGRKSVYTGKGESIENQIELCRQYIAAKFPEAGDAEITVYEDEGFSAKNTDRPQFQQMLRDLRSSRPDYIICYRLDRISRNVSDFSGLIEELNDRNISFICIKEEFDTSKPMGKAMMYIASVFAQLERETIAERVRDNMLLLARTGRWLGGTPPTGYTSEKVREVMIDGKVKTSCKLKENPDELCAVDAMFEKYLELRSISGVSKYLIQQGIHARSGKNYSLPGIKEILQNPVYCTADRDAWEFFTAQNSDVCFEEADFSGRYGILAYNKRDYRKKRAPRQPMDKWIIAAGRHRGRIPGKKWVAVQNIIADHIPTGKKPAKTHNEDALLSGLICCGQCGERMFAKRRSGKGARSGQYDYICGGKLRGGRALCGSQNLNGRQVDDLVFRRLMQDTGESAQIYPLLEGLKRELRAQAEESPLAAVDTRIKKCGGELDSLVRTLAQGELAPALLQRVNARVAALDAELSELNRERERLQRETGSAAAQEERADRLVRTLSSLKSSSETLSVPEKRALIKILVRKILWDGKELHIFPAGA